MRHLILIGAVLGGLFGAAHIGSAKSERAHRTIDMHYRQCEERYGFGGEGFPECLRGKR